MSANGDYKLQCPDCGGRIRVRTSAGESLTVRVAYLQCQNLTCGSTFRAVWEITHRMNNPVETNEKVNIPLADWAEKRELQFAEGEKQLDIYDVINA